MKTTEVLKNPSMYYKAISGFIVTLIGALITSGLLTGNAAKIAGAVVTAAASFTTVFATPNKAPKARKRRTAVGSPRPVIDTDALDQMDKPRPINAKNEIGAALPFAILVALVVIFLILGLVVAKLFLYVCLAFAIAAFIALVVV